MKTSTAVALFLILAPMSSAMTAQEAHRITRQVLSQLELDVPAAAFSKNEALPESTRATLSRNSFFLQAQHPLVGKINSTIGGRSGNIVISTSREGSNSRGENRTGARKWTTEASARGTLEALCRRLSQTGIVAVREFTMSVDTQVGGRTEGGIVSMKADFLAGGVPFLDAIVGVHLRVDSQDGAFLYASACYRLPELMESDSFGIDEHAARDLLLSRFPGARNVGQMRKRAGWARPPGSTRSVLSYKFEAPANGLSSIPILIEAKSSGRVWRAGER